VLLNFPGSVRLDLLLIRRNPGLSRRKAREVIEKGQVDVDGHTLLESGAEVAAEARVTWDANRPARTRARPGLPLLYSDDAILIVDKPAGLLSVPTSPDSQEDCVALRMRAYAARLRPHRPYLGVVHRLDRDTSGALALALDPRARQALRALFRSHLVERRYLALVAGTPPRPEGTIELPIRDAYVSGRRGVARPEEAGKPARTHYRVRETFRSAALLELELFTGRQHQIRIHLAHIGLPVLGDAVYGRSDGLRAPRQMLHAAVLGFAHPLTGQSVRGESPPPPDFDALLARLRREPGGRVSASRGRPGAG
jgi:23S rRNA pseudouridine1911/1915/1917 synthase